MENAWRCVNGREALCELKIGLGFRDAEQSCRIVVEPAIANGGCHY